MMGKMDEISAFSKHSREWIEENFDVVKQADRLTRIYNDLIES
jgi:hypothetical protein